MVVRHPGLGIPLALAIALGAGLAMVSSTAGVAHTSSERPVQTSSGSTAPLLADILDPVWRIVERLGVELGDTTLDLALTEGAEHRHASRSTRESGAASLPRWTGGVNVFRRGVFSTQRAWSWCTAAGVQIMRNIVHGRSDHSRASQQRYFAYMRAHDRYTIPVRDGVDPAGWAAGLRRWVDPRYRIVAQRSFRAALRSAVTRLRTTNLPIAIGVAHGNHAWVLTGFTATADPAATRRFRVTSVRVTGPLWGRQNSSYGYDMRPDTRLTRAQLERFFTPWHYPRVRMTWEGHWVSIQPAGR